MGGKKKEDHCRTDRRYNQETFCRLGNSKKDIHRTKEKKTQGFDTDVLVLARVERRVLVPGQEGKARQLLN